MAGLEGAIKDLFQAELQSVQDKQSTQDQRHEDMAKAIQELSGKVVDHEKEADKLRDELGKFQKDMEDSNVKTQDQLGVDIKELKERLNRIEGQDDQTGMGGLKQVHEKCTELTKGLGDIQPQLQDSLRAVKENTDRTEECDRMLKDLERQCKSITDSLAASQERVTKMDGVTTSVSTAVQALEDSVTRKYEKLWDNILDRIEEMKSTQVDEMRKDLDNQNQARSEKTRSMVNYALNFMASAHGERRQMAINRSLVLAWHQQSRNRNRRVLGFAYLQRIMQHRPTRGAFDLWHRRHDTSSLCDRLKGQYTDQLSNVRREIKDGDAELKDRCNKLDGSVVALTASTQKSLDDNIQQLRQWTNKELEALVPIKATLKEHGDVQKRHEEHHRSHTDAEANLDAKLGGLVRDLEQLSADSQVYAKSEEVKGMIRDILMIWTSIKQLDTAKADKKDVDNFAVETANRDKLSERRLGDLESDLTTKERQDTLRIQEKWNELDGRLDESGRQFRHWEQMWEKLSGFVEDLVVKINDLQGRDHKLPPAESLRMSRPGSASRDNLVRSRAEIPTMPLTPGGSYGGHDNSAVTRGHASDRGSHQHHAEAIDAKMMWINSAKGIVDATLDQAVNSLTPTATRPRSRPKSVPRRPLDRTR